MASTLQGVYNKKYMSEAEKKQKIIIVDDDEFLVNMYATKFASSGVEVEACKSGDELIQKLQSGTTAELILLDVIMPGLSGTDTLKKMKAEKLGDSIPVMMLTNQSDEKDIEEVKNMGITGYIVKSAATPTEVVSEVLNVINK